LATGVAGAIDEVASYAIAAVARVTSAGKTTTIIIAVCVRMAVVGFISTLIDVDAVSNPEALHLAGAVIPSKATGVTWITRTVRCATGMPWASSEIADYAISRIPVVAST
tara:strand:+ start:567 stop:896 length:330 start_codon:yes stop_codon:yes gene_type:complete